MLGEFHSRDGFYFKRGDDGSVQIRVAAAESTQTMCEVSIPSNEWASVIATVSHTGEDAASWEAAKLFHNG